MDIHQESQEPAPEPRRPDAPLNLDDAVLVYSSDGEVHPAVHAHPEPSQCCQSPSIEDSTVALFTEVIFKGERRNFYLNRTGAELQPEQYVIVEAEKGIDMGRVGSTGSVAYMKCMLRNKPCAQDIKNLSRLAEEEEIKVLQFHREQEQNAHDICVGRIHHLNLVMKLVDVEFQLDRNRITFYFTADGRVDFRELVRELAGEYRTRIELRQIGPRDEAKRVGGYGVCGRELCCSSWLGTFEPISTDMARLQNLSLNPFKLAGQCGRLKCCLAFEAHLYEELLKRFPPLDYSIKTKKGIGKIEKIDIFQDALFLHFAESDSWERMTLEEVKSYIQKA